MCVHGERSNVWFQCRFSAYFASGCVAKTRKGDEWLTKCECHVCLLCNCHWDNVSFEFRCDSLALSLSFFVASTLPTFIFLRHSENSSLHRYNRTHTNTRSHRWNRSLYLIHTQPKVDTFSWRNEQKCLREFGSQLMR